MILLLEAAIVHFAESVAAERVSALEDSYPLLMPPMTSSRSPGCSWDAAALLRLWLALASNVVKLHLSIVMAGVGVSLVRAVCCWAATTGGDD